MRRSSITPGLIRHIASTVITIAPLAVACPLLYILHSWLTSVLTSNFLLTISDFMIVTLFMACYIKFLTELSKDDGNKDRYEDGYSLIELITVMAIVAILSAVALVSYQSQAKSIRQKVASASVVGLLQTAGNAVVNYWKAHNTKPARIEDAVFFMEDDPRPNLVNFYGRRGEEYALCVAICGKNKIPECTSRENSSEYQDEKGICLMTWLTGTKKNTFKVWTLTCPNKNARACKLETVADDKLERLFKKLKENGRL